MNQELKIDFYGISLFCDDVREEKRGKLSFIGIYSNTFYVDSFPWKGASLSVVSILRDLNPDEDYNLRVFFKNEEFRSIKLPPIPPAATGQLNVIMTLSDLVIDEAGAIEVTLGCPKGTRKTGSLRIEERSKPE